MANDFGYVQTIQPGEWATIQRDLARLRRIEELARAVEANEEIMLEWPDDDGPPRCPFCGGIILITNEPQWKILSHSCSDDCPWAQLRAALEEGDDGR